MVRCSCLKFLTILSLIVYVEIPSETLNLDEFSKGFRIKGQKFEWKMLLEASWSFNLFIAAHIDKTGKLSEHEACRVFWQIIAAVSYCHRRHVVHRDLKVTFKCITLKLLQDGKSNPKAL